MYARLKFVSPGSPEKYSWVIDTSSETIDHWQHAHPEAEDIVVLPLDESEGLEALFWQKCLYHDVFFERSTCRDVRERGHAELVEILDLAGRLPKGRASELWNRCMDFRFHDDVIVKGEYSHRLPV
jgi:hypothetical protein